MRRLAGRLAAAMAIALLGTAGAQASCWDHNGSVMRLDSRGESFTIKYERPRKGLRASGVRRGTLLVDGRYTSNGLAATARRFSRHCVGRPLEYDVDGYFEGDYTIYLAGTRPVYKACQPTGRSAYDELTFDFIGDC